MVYLHIRLKRLIFIVNVGQYTSPMDASWGTGVNTPVTWMVVGVTTSHVCRGSGIHQTEVLGCPGTGSDRITGELGSMGLVISPNLINGG